jgi:hypothetical protein
MANLSKDLKTLFDKYLYGPKKSNIETRHEGYTPPVRGFCEFTGIIYFYEWSDATRTPKSFYSLEKFEEFLNKSGIYLKSYQREIIKCMHNPYIACKKGERDLIIKKSYEMLKNELCLSFPKPTPPTPATYRGSEDREPYSVAITRPPMVFEQGGRYPDYMDCCGRGHMQGEFWDW